MDRAAPEKPDTRWVVNASEQPVEFFACSDSRITLMPGDQRPLVVPPNCNIVSAEQFGVPYEARASELGKPTKLFTFVMGGSREFPMAWNKKHCVCFENQSPTPASVTIPGREEPLTVDGRRSLNNVVCMEGNRIEAVYKGVSPTKGDVKGVAAVRESGVWVNSGQLRYEILS